MLGVSDLAGAAAVALALVDADEEIAAVLPCDPGGTGRLVYLCALRASGAEDLTGWLAITDDQAISEADTVRRAASIVALCETAEEAAGVPDADSLLDAVRHAREQAGAVAGLAAVLRVPWGDWTAPAGTPDGAVEVVVRPDALRLDTNGQISAVVTCTRFAGAHVDVTRERESGPPLVLSVDQHDAPDEGARITIACDARAVLVYPPN